MRSLLFLILFSICGVAQAQTYEIGVFGGGAAEKKDAQYENEG